MSIASKISEITSSLPASVRLVAVSKFHPASAVLEAYNAGQRIFGESHVQELSAKYEALPKDIQWHFIGHLQTNKVKYIVPFVALIHSVDTVKLLQEVEKQAARQGRVVPCLLEVHVALEESKFGFTIASLRTLFQQQAFANFPHIRFDGLMGMATHTADVAQVQSEFHLLSSFYAECKAQYMPSFSQLSMGMSHDYLLAIQEGSTLVRIGTSIFGERDYSQS